MVNEYYQHTDCSVEGQEYRRQYEEGLGLNEPRASLRRRLRDPGLSAFDKNLIKKKLV